jgi:pseudaminic acid biosynthesis-associated methylase
MKSFSNISEQEKFWKGNFGDEYIGRDKLDSVASNTSFFSEIIGKTNNIRSILELGCNIGNNLKAIKNIIPEAELHGVEINSKAVEVLKKEGNFDVIESSIQDYSTNKTFDLVFTKTVLIHINPEDLKPVYKKIYDYSNKYIVIAEYYNPNPVSVTYRGNEEKLFKRDFAGDFMKMFPDVSLIDYGFKYHKDNVFPQDDITWFLLCKNNTY